MLEFSAKIVTDDQSPGTSDREAEEATDGPDARVIEFPTPKADEKDKDPGEHE